MEFEWYESKRLSNIAKHHIDFIDMQIIFDGRPTLTAPSTYAGELRFLTTGETGGIFYSIVWTWRDDVVRIISARRARDAEKRNYRSIYG